MSLLLFFRPHTFGGPPPVTATPDYIVSVTQDLRTCVVPADKKTIHVPVDPTGTDA
jgi:hypothetical protein